MPSYPNLTRSERFSSGISDEILPQVTRNLCEWKYLSAAALDNTDPIQRSCTSFFFLKILIDCFSSSWLTISTSSRSIFVARPHCTHILSSKSSEPSPFPHRKCQRRARSFIHHTRRSYRPVLWILRWDVTRQRVPAKSEAAVVPRRFLAK